MRRMSRPLLDSMLGFAAGVMIAASVWSLLIPSLDLAQQQGVIPWLPAVVGLLLGGIVMRLIANERGVHVRLVSTVLLCHRLCNHARAGRSITCRLTMDAPIASAAIDMNTTG